MKQLHLSSRVDNLEKTVKQLVDVQNMLLSHLASARKLNAHYLISINTLAKELVKAGVSTDSSLHKTRAEVVQEADFEKRRTEWIDKCVFYDSLTDKWFFWDLDCNKEIGPFADDNENDFGKKALQAAMTYIKDEEEKRSVAWLADKPKMLSDRITHLENIARVDVLKRPLEKEDAEQLGDQEERT
jgi:hypothetical protein